MIARTALLFATVVGAVLMCAPASFATDYDWRLPPGFPPPLVPATNAMNAAKVALGERLFRDGRLSVTGTYSCASCHDPARAFTDGRTKARGATGEVHARNTPTLVNAAYGASLGWLDEGVRDLEIQHEIPLFNAAPVEMGFDAVMAERLPALRADPDIAALVPSAFDGLSADRFDLPQIVGALAAYVRTLVFADSAFDRYLYWGEPSLSSEALAGLTLYLSPRTGCADCHGGFNLSGPVVHERAPATAPVFFGGVRAPTLRNVAVTAPYMHDGDMATLDVVLEFYARVGRDGPVELTASERTSLLAFLDSLTDRRWR